MTRCHSMGLSWDLQLAEEIGRDWVPMRPLHLEQRVLIAARLKNSSWRTAPVAASWRTSTRPGASQLDEHVFCAHFAHLPRVTNVTARCAVARYTQFADNACALGVSVVVITRFIGRSPHSPRVYNGSVTPISGSYLPSTFTALSVTQNKAEAGNSTCQTL